MTGNVKWVHLSNLALKTVIPLAEPQQFGIFINKTI